MRSFSSVARGVRPQAVAVCAALLGFLLPNVARAEPSDHRSLLNPDGCLLVSFAEEETPEARRDFMRSGIEASRKGDWREARTLFHKAWCSAPNFAIAASLADVEMKLGAYKDAARHWTYFLDNAPAERKEERTEAESQLAECRLHLGRLKVLIRDAPANARIWIDGERPVDWRDGEELWLELGERTVYVTSPSGRSPELKLSITAGQVRIAEFILPPPAPAPGLPEPAAASQQAITLPSTDAPKSESSGTRTALVITGGALTAVAVGLGIAFKLEADRAEDDWASYHTQLEPGECASSDPPAACDNLSAAIEHHDAALNRSTGSFIAAGVLGAATVATYLFWPAERKPAARVSVAPWSLPRGHGVQARVAF